MDRVTDWDVLVVGAGPAGSSAAEAAARNRARTLLVDAKTRIGEPNHCAEFVPKQLFSEYSADRSCIVQSVDRMATYVSAGDSFTQFADNSAPAAITESPGYTIDRTRFDFDLARGAAEAGALVKVGTRLVARNGNYWVLKSRDGTRTITARCIVAADGARSRVAELLGLPAGDTVAGVQARVLLCNPLNETRIYLHPAIVLGYAWLFPKGATANVGLGMVPHSESSARDLLNELLDALVREKTIQQSILGTSSGAIPVTGLRERLVHDNTIFCGDAAGLTHPVSGAGVPQAVISGVQAGRAAAMAALTGNTAHLAEYESDIRSHFGGVLNHALSKRRIMTTQWPTDDFPTLCEQTWIAFKGYRKRVNPSAR